MNEQPFSTQANAAGSDPLELILRTTGGYCVARSLHVVADLGEAIRETACQDRLGMIDVADDAAGKECDSQSSDPFCCVAS